MEITRGEFNLQKYNGNLKYTKQVYHKNIFYDSVYVANYNKEMNLLLLVPRSNGKTLYLIDCVTGKIIRNFRHKGYISDFTFYSNEIYSADSTGIFVWNTISGTIVKEIKAINSFMHLAINEAYIYYSIDNILYKYNKRTSSEETIKCTKDTIFGVILCDNYLIIEISKRNSAYDIQCLNTKNGKEIWTYNLFDSFIEASIVVIEQSVQIPLRKNKILILDLKNGNTKSILKNIYDINRDILIRNSDGELGIINEVNNGNEITTIIKNIPSKTSKKFVRNRNYDIRSLNISKDGKLFSSGENGNITIWSLKTGEREIVEFGEIDDLFGLSTAISQDGNYLVAFSEQTIKVFKKQIEKYCLINRLEHKYHVSQIQIIFNKNSNVPLLCVTDSKSGITIYGFGGEILKIEKYKNQNLDKNIKTILNENKLLIITEHLVELFLLKYNKFKFGLRHNALIRDCAVTADGNLLIINDENYHIQIYSIKDFKCVYSYGIAEFVNKDSFCKIYVSPNGRYLIVNSHENIFVLNLKTGQRIHTLDTNSSSTRESVCFYGEILISAGSAGTIKIWNMETSELLATIHNINDILWETPPDDIAPNGWLWTNNKELISVFIKNHNSLPISLAENDEEFNNYLNNYNRKDIVLSRINDFRKYEKTINIMKLASIPEMPIENSYSINILPPRTTDNFHKL